MCGFLVAPETLFPKVKGPAQTRAEKALMYRGDQDPVWTSGGGWRILHTRLEVSVENEDAGQPFFWGSHKTQSRHMTAYVGEVFPENHLLEKEQITFSLDSERLSRFMSLDGFWAIADVDLNSGTLRVLTDHLSIKPVYVHLETRVFSSDLNAIVELLRETHTITLDNTYLSNCIKFGYDYSGRTPFKEIIQMQPGSIFLCSPMGYLEQKSYWDWGRVPACEGSLFHEVFTSAVVQRVDYVSTPHEVGVLYSGGLDSSLIVHTLSKEGLLDKVSLLHLSTGEEGPIPEHLKASLYTVRPEDFDQGDGLLRSICEVQGTPCDLGSAYLQIGLCRALSEEINARVVVTGDGADEVFGGYRRAREYDSQSSDVFCELPFYHLPRLDRTFMQFQLEQRSPFLAPQIVKAGLGLPYHRRNNKQFLRDYAQFLGMPGWDAPKVPLKSEAVKTGGVLHRRLLVETFVGLWSTVIGA